jgi:hypothetical protein
MKTKIKTKLINRLSLLINDENLEEKINRSPVYLIAILAITNIIVLKLIFLLI